MLTLCNLANNVLLSVLLLGLNSRGPQLCSDHKPSLQEEDRETEHSVHELEAGMEKLDRQTDRQTDKQTATIMWPSTGWPSNMFTSVCTITIL